MKNFKKVLSGFVALTMCMFSNTFSVNASTTPITYLQGDVDGNGSVNLIDAITMVQFLNGNIGADPLTAVRLDVNGDYIINEYDKSIISSIVLGDINPTTLTCDGITSFPQSSNRSYYKYDLNTNQRTTYNLDVVSNIAPRGIIGTDDRVQENGLNGVLKAGDGTAFVIDTHTILTAAHVIYNKNTSNIITNFDFEIYDDYNTPSNITITPTAYHIPTNYVNDTVNGWKYDYAIVTIEEDLSSYINFDLGVIRQRISKPIYVTGFGNDAEGVATSLENTKSTGIGTLSPLNTPFDLSYWDYAIYYTTDAVEGNSGSPTYIVNTDGTKTVIGINSNGNNRFNQAIRITTDILHFVYSNDNL